MASIINQGFVPLPISQPDSPSIFLSELLLINSTCTVNSIICVGASINGSNIMLEISCGDCWSILKFTSLNSPTFVNGAYWFMTLNITFGFSSMQLIDQNNCVNNIQTNGILCWLLVDVDDSVDFKKKKLFKSAASLDYTKHIYMLNASNLLTTSLTTSTVSLSYPTQSNSVSSTLPIQTVSFSSTPTIISSSNSFTTNVIYEKNSTSSSLFIMNSSSISTDYMLSSKAFGNMTEQSTFSFNLNESTLTSTISTDSTIANRIACVQITDPFLIGKNISTWYICFPLSQTTCSNNVFIPFIFICLFVSI